MTRKTILAAVLACCLSSVDARIVYCQETAKNAAVLLHELQSPQTTDQATVRLLELGKTDPRVRAYLASHLPRIIQRDPKYAPEPWTNAVRLAGTLKIPETARSLTKWISIDNVGDGTSLTEFMRLDTDPAGKALAQIGDPAIPALSEVLNKGNARERRDACLSLRLIGSPASKNVLVKHVRAERDPGLRKFLEDMLKAWDTDQANRRRKATREERSSSGSRGHSLHLFAFASRAPGQAVTIVISTPNTNPRIGQAIPLTITLTNRSGQRIRVPRSTAKNQAEMTYRIILLDSQGHPVLQTADAQIGIIVSQVGLPVEPGHALVQHTELNKLFKITEPGTYTVRVGRMWPPMKGKMEWSNTLTLTVTP
jgi:hypothetical protein